jgi:hypothetical protein
MCMAPLLSHRIAGVQTDLLIEADER